MILFLGKKSFETISGSGLLSGQMWSNGEPTFEVPNIQYINGPIKAENSPKEVGNRAIWAYARPCGITVVILVVYI